MSTVSGTVAVSSTIKESLAAGTNRAAGYDVPLNPSFSYSFSDGSGAGTVTVSGASVTATIKANKSYFVTGTASAANVDIDLTATTNTDGTTGFSHVRQLILINLATTDGYTFDTGAGTNPFVPYLGGTTPTMTIYPGEVRTITRPTGSAGLTVDSTHKTLRVAPGSNNVPYAIIVLGD